MSDIEEWQNQKESELARRAGFEDQPSDYELSEEEVMGIEPEEEEEEETNWGQSKRNYYGGADDQGDESAQEDEEEEALKLQERMANEMAEDDYFDEDDAEGWKKDAEDAPEELEIIQDPSNMDSSARLTLLQQSYPEVLLLAKELEKCKNSRSEILKQEGEVKDIKLTALNSYMAMIYSYYALFTSQAQQGAIDLKEHPVMESILKARELWRLASRLGSDDEELEELEEVSGEDMPEVGTMEDLDGAEEFDSENLDEEEELGEQGAEGFDSEIDSDASNSEDEFKVALPLAAIKVRKTKQLQDYDEAADTIEQQARAKNKQSLRFYTSAIDKKNAIKEDKFAGDLDLPYAERAFERRKRLQEEARLRGLQKKDKLGQESEHEASDNEQQPANELYSKAKAASKSKKDNRREMHEAAVEAAKQGRIGQFIAENAEASDKRAISYQIQKNRGLTPKRAKINRNSRLKKRVRYEDAKKKLRGLRREYKGQSGPYTGESSGIRKNVVHSTKF